MTRLALEKTIDMSTEVMSVMHPRTRLITVLVRERSGLETRRRGIVYCETTRFVLPIAAYGLKAGGNLRVLAIKGKGSMTLARAGNMFRRLNEEGERETGDWGTFTTQHALWNLVSLGWLSISDLDSFTDMYLSLIHI